MSVTLYALEPDEYNRGIPPVDILKGFSGPSLFGSKAQLLRVGFEE
jgi:hypothetical protein